MKSFKMSCERVAMEIAGAAERSGIDLEDFSVDARTSADGTIVDVWGKDLLDLTKLMKSTASTIKALRKGGYVTDENVPVIQFTMGIAAA
jgi:hypothetical protein